MLSQLLRFRYSGRQCTEAVVMMSFSILSTAESDSSFITQSWLLRCRCFLLSVMLLLMAAAVDAHSTAGTQS